MLTAQHSLVVCVSVAQSSGGTLDIKLERPAWLRLVCCCHRYPGNIKLFEDVSSPVVREIRISFLYICTGSMFLGFFWSVSSLNLFLTILQGLFFLVTILLVFIFSPFCSYCLPPCCKLWGSQISTWPLFHCCGIFGLFFSVCCKQFHSIYAIPLRSHNS